MLQSLSHTHAFHQELLVVDDCQGKLRESFIEAVFELTDDTHRPVFPLRQVADRFFEKVSRFDNDRQHDSHECLRHFLEEIKKEERESKSSSPTDHQLTVVDKVFGGHLITVYICKECDKHYHLFEPCLDISLPVFFDAEPRRTSSEETDKSTRKDVQSKQENSVLMDVSEPLPDYDSEEGAGYGYCKSHASGNYDNCLNQDVSNRPPYNESMNQDRPKLSIKETNDRTSDQDRNDVAIARKAKDNRKIQKRGDDKKKDDDKQAIMKLMTRLSHIQGHSSTGESKHRRYNSSISIGDCFTHFSRIEQIQEEYLCEDCLREAMATGKASEDNLKLTSATRQTLIFNPPAILTIHFKRFELLPGRSRKRSDIVGYSEYLDIAPYCSSQCLRNDPPRNNIWYSLYAVVVHSGSLNSGHYKTYVKMREKEKNFEKLKAFFQQEYFNHNVTSDELIGMMNEKKSEKSEDSKQPEREESKWYLMNDSSVYKVRVDEVLRQEAYLLFYEREY